MAEGTGPSRYQQRAAGRELLRAAETAQLSSSVSQLASRRESEAKKVNVQCQKCLARGHYTYECKGERVYAQRASASSRLGSGATERVAVAPPPEAMARSGLLYNDPRRGVDKLADPVLQNAVVAPATHTVPSASLASTNKSASKGKSSAGRKRGRSSSRSSRSSGTSDSDTGSYSYSDSYSYTGSYSSYSYSSYTGSSYSDTDSVSSRSRSRSRGHEREKASKKGSSESKKPLETQDGAKAKPQKDSTREHRRGRSAGRSASSSPSPKRRR